MRPILLLLLLAIALCAAEAGAQVPSGPVLDERMVPGGWVRLSAIPSFTSWDSRFGVTADGRERIEPLGLDLTTGAPGSSFPSVSAMAESLEAITGVAGYEPMLGAVEARITHDITRIDIGVHLGLFDWLTVGVVAPRVKARTAVALGVIADTLSTNVGMSPVGTDPAAVSTLLANLQASADAAQARADFACAGGAPECAAAQDLATRAAAFDQSLREAYSASPFFPLAGSAMAGSLNQAVTTLDTELVAAGLGGITAPVPFAATPLTPEGFASLPAQPGSAIQSSPIESRSEIWGWGDVELSASLRLLEGEAGGASSEPPSFTYRLLGGVVARLGTGLHERPNVILDLGTGDGQTDIEGWAQAAITLGSHVGLSVGGRYGVQGARTLTRRVARPEDLLAPASTGASVQWTPGDYIGLAVAPSLRLTRELAITADYRYFSKDRDRFEAAAGSVLPAGAVGVLSTETEVTVHQVGGALVYESTAPWLGGTADRLLQLHARVLHAVRGSGGQTPVSTRIEFGLSLFQGLWGSR